MYLTVFWAQLSCLKDPLLLLYKFHLPWHVQGMSFLNKVQCVSKWRSNIGSYQSSWFLWLPFLFYLLNLQFNMIFFLFLLIFDLTRLDFLPLAVRFSLVSCSTSIPCFSFITSIPFCESSLSPAANHAQIFSPQSIDICPWLSQSIFL